MIKIKIFLSTSLLLLAACSQSPNRVENQPIYDQPPEATADVPGTIEDASPTAEISSPCERFSGVDISIHLLDFYPTSSSLTLYAEFPRAVTGFDEGGNNVASWQYTASLGDVESVWCSTFEGEQHAGRLYCRIPLPVEYRGTSKPFVLSANLCEAPILSIPALELTPTENSTGSNLDNDLHEQSLKICGSAPEGSCSAEFEHWCSCMGGFYSCWETYDFPKCDIP